MKTLQVILGLSMAGTLLAAVFAPDAPTDVVAPTQRSAAAAPRGGPNAGTPVEVLAIRRRTTEEAAPHTGVFRTTKMAPKVPRVEPPNGRVEAVPPAPPVQPPAIPFRVLGRYQDSGDETVFLQHGDLNLAVRAGDVLNEHYKVESISGGVLTLIYLPLNLRQTLAIGDTP